MGPGRPLDRSRDRAATPLTGRGGPGHDRRRTKQDTYNREHNITPIGINKAVKDLTERVRKVAEERGVYKTGTAVGELPIPKDEIVKLLKELEKQMKQAAKDLEFEKAAALRDQVIELRRTMALDLEGV